MPKTPKKTVDDAMVDLTLAPRKMKHGPCLANFLHEPLDNVKREYHLSGNRVCSFSSWLPERDILDIQSPLK